MKKLKTTELGRVSLEEFKKQDKLNAVIVLDNVRSLNNVGSAFRTADAFATQKLYLCGITGKPPHRDIQKTALGAQDAVTWEYFENIKECIGELKKNNYTIVLIEQTDESISLSDFVPESTESYAFVFGNEVFGVSDAILDDCDIALEIPQFGTKHSLNVSVTVGVVLWDMLSKK